MLRWIIIAVFLATPALAQTEYCRVVKKPVQGCNPNNNKNCYLKTVDCTPPQNKKSKK